MSESLSNTEREWITGWAQEAIDAWRSHTNAESEERRKEMVEFFENLKRKFVLPGMEETDDVKKLDHKVDYLDRIETLEKEVKSLTDQAASFRDLALSHADLIRRAAEAITTARQGGTMLTVYYANLLAELHAAVKD
jgi:hypothetical protein